MEYPKNCLEFKLTHKKKDNEEPNRKLENLKHTASYSDKGCESTGRGGNSAVLESGKTLSEGLGR